MKEDCIRTVKESKAFAIFFYLYPGSF
uniref:Uncharacterized protein n=1 Tax=Rhizophora mucronata TaxID=61149 RepID=A0A2P2PZM9_RHIMU